jgi:hypothetical protein
MTDQGLKYLFVVSDRDVVERRTVRLGDRHDGLRTVKEGLKEGEWVVVDGLEAVRADMTVRPERVAMPTRSTTPRDTRGRPWSIATNSSCHAPSSRRIILQVF